MMVFALFWFGAEEPGDAAVPPRHVIEAAPPRRLEEYEERLGYNNPVTEEYGKWVKGLFVGRTITIGPTEYDCPAPCLGLSYRTHQPVYDELTDRLPATISIAVGAASLYLLVGVTVGVFAARRRGTLADKATGRSATLFLSSIPYYLMALLALLYLCIVWGILDRGYQPWPTAGKAAGSAT